KIRIMRWSWRRWRRCARPPPRRAMRCGPGGDLRSCNRTLPAAACRAMWYLIIKAALSGVLIAIISEVAKRYPGLGGLIASLPLVSVLGMIWLWRDRPDAANMAAHAEATFWFVLPSLP